MENKNLLQVKDLSVILEDKKILENVSFELKSGEVLAVVGPNGAGKSVLLKTLLGLIPKTSGEIIWQDGIKIGYLPQRFHVDFYLPMTVREFLELKPNPKYSLDEVLKLININPDWLKRRLSHLSSGELQKVLLAWAILDKPQILLFDEPTENVDVVSQKSIYDLFHNFQDELNISIILVSHDLHIVYRYASQVLCLNQKMICHGEPQILTTEVLSELYGDHAFFRHNHFH